MKTNPGKHLLSAAESYLLGRTSYWDLYTLALDVVPSVVHSDPEATELAGAIIASEAEISLDDEAKEAEERREMIKEAMPRSVR
jgi:hypothetical protein